MDIQKSIYFNNIKDYVIAIVVMINKENVVGFIGKQLILDDPPKEIHAFFL